MKLKYLYLSALVLLSISCENPDSFLDVVPTGKVIPTTLQDYESLLKNYAILRERNINLNLIDPDAYQVASTYSLLNNVNKNAYKWNGQLYAVSETDYDYNYSYSYIYVSNLVIEEVDAAPTGNVSPAERPNLKGEAYAQRAMEYFYLVNEYAQHYDPAHTDAKGVPMPLKLDLSANLGYSTVGDVYKQIISDLETALSLYTDTRPAIMNENYRPGKASIYALLAEVYLYMGDFNKAVINSDRALSLYSYLYDFKTIGFTSSSNLWNGYTDSTIGITTLNKEVLWGRYSQYSFNYPYQLYSPEKVALYDKVNDRRWYLQSVQKNSAGSLNVAPNFLCLYSRGERQNGMDVARLLLTNAEAKVRTKDGIGAMVSLNKLLTKRIVNFVPYVHSSDATTLQLIKTERRKELHGSALNVFDLKRYHVYGEPVDTYTRVIPDTGETVTLTPGSKGYVIDIPLAVKAQNPNL